jgi:ABC-type ATPase with predicted acetyltransferase domain
LLDRLTAAIVSRSIRRLIDRMPRLSAILATCHDDVERPLQPDRTVRCDFGKLSS